MTVKESWENHYWKVTIELPPVTRKIICDARTEFNDWVNRAKWSAVLILDELAGADKYLKGSALPAILRLRRAKKNDVCSTTLHWQKQLTVWFIMMTTADYCTTCSWHARTLLLLRVRHDRRRQSLQGNWWRLQEGSPFIPNQTRLLQLQERLDALFLTRTDGNFFFFFGWFLELGSTV